MHRRDRNSRPLPVCTCVHIRLTQTTNDASPMRASAADADVPPLVLVLCGRCGAGKSATCNTLLGRTHFTSRRSATAVTHECLSAETTTPDGRQRLILMDTPGLSDPELSESEVHAGIIAGVAALAEAHAGARFAVGLVVSLAGRMDLAALQDFSRLGLVFGRNLFEHSVLLWTHGDLLLEETVADVGVAGGRGSSGSGGDQQPDPPRHDYEASSSALDAAFAAYLDGAGEEVAAWLSNVKGGSHVLRNRGAHGPATVFDDDHTRRVIERAAGVAGHASQLAPPKPHRKAARRERQQALREEATRAERRAADSDRGPAAAAAAGERGRGVDDPFAAFSWSGFLSWLTGATSVQPRGAEAGELAEGSNLLEHGRQSRTSHARPARSNESFNGSLV